MTDELTYDDIVAKLSQLGNVTTSPASRAQRMGRATRPTVPQGAPVVVTDFAALAAPDTLTDEQRRRIHAT